tara:strand:+ start:372 stop:1505 length:1134 start_codon:yes stop_codon:yes gene_type:complete
MKIGNLDITNPKIGTTPINKVYIGANQVWPNIVNEFIFQIDTSLGDGLNTFDFNPGHYTAGSIDYVIDWGDSSTTTVTTNTNSIHTYSSSGVYDIKVFITSGISNYDLNQFRCPDYLKVVDVKNWGSYSGATFYQSFRGSRLIVSAIDELQSISGNFSECFYACPNITGVKIKNPINLTNTFRYCGSFIGTGLETCNVENVISFESCFQQSSINVDLSNWVNYKGLTYKSMFRGVSSYTYGLDNLVQPDTLGADCSTMFYQASFNPDVSNWNTLNVDTFRSFLLLNSSFVSDLSNFNIENAWTLQQMFQSNPLTDSLYQSYLISWTGWNGTTATKTLQNNVPAHFHNAKYELGGQSEDVRNYLINTLGWTITDGGGI